MKLYVSASAEQWQKLGYEILAKAGEAKENGTMQMEFPAKVTGFDGNEFDGTIQFDNEDMEERPDLAPDAMFGGME